MHVGVTEMNDNHILAIDLSAGCGVT